MPGREDRDGRPAPLSDEPRGGRDWWLRTLLVLQAPRAVFAALRNDSDEAAADRAEPVVAILVLAGIAGVLTTRTAAHLMDHSDYDGTLVAIWALIAGSLYGGAVYWLFGAFLHRSGVSLGSAGSYRRARHVLAFAAVPVAASLLLLPVKLALYGSDLFRRGGGDAGTGGKAFVALQLAFSAWALALLVIGVRTVHGWSWARAGSTVAAAAALPAAIALAVLLV